MVSCAHELYQDVKSFPMLYKVTYKQALTVIPYLGRVSPQSAALGGLGNKPAVTCEICGKKLADPSSLYRHRKIHSGDKPHKCPYCTRRFIQRYNFEKFKI